MSHEAKISDLLIIRLIKNYYVTEKTFIYWMDLGICLSRMFVLSVVQRECLHVYYTHL